MVLHIIDCNCTYRGIRRLNTQDSVRLSTQDSVRLLVPRLWFGIWDWWNQESIQHTLAEYCDLSLRPILECCCKMRWLNIMRSLLPVKSGRKILGEIFCFIVLSFIQVYSNLFENLFVAKPMHVHLPCYGLFWFHAGIYKTISGGVFCFERSRRFFVTETTWKHEMSSGQTVKTIYGQTVKTI